MKNLKLVLFFLFAFCISSFAQSGKTRKFKNVYVTKKLQLNTIGITEFSTDGTFASPDDNSLATTQAIYDFVNGEITAIPLYWSSDAFGITTADNVGIRRASTASYSLDVHAHQRLINTGNSPYFDIENNTTNWNFSAKHNTADLWIKPGSVNGILKFLNTGNSSIAELDIANSTFTLTGLATGNESAVFTAMATIDDLGQLKRSSYADVAAALDPFIAGGGSSLWETDVNGIIATGNPNIGIGGASSSTSSLLVTGDVETTGAFVDANDMLIKSGTGVYEMKSPDLSNEYQVVAQNSGDVLNGYMFGDLRWIDASSSELMRLTQTGELGIGIAAPQTSIHTLNGLRFGNLGSASAWVFSFTGSTYTTPNSLGRGLSYYSYISNTTGNTVGFAYTGDGYNAVSGTHDIIRIAKTFNPSSGTASYTGLKIAGSMNQTGTATGISRGIHIQPSIVNIEDYRALEISNNESYGIYQDGISAKNYLNGNTGFGVSNPLEKVSIAGDVRQYNPGNLYQTWGDNVDSWDWEIHSPLIAGDGDLRLSTSADKRFRIQDSNDFAYAIFDANNGDVQMYSLQLDNSVGGESFKNALKRSSIGNALQLGSTTLSDWQSVYIPEDVGVNILLPNTQLHLNEDSANGVAVQFTNDTSGEGNLDGAKIEMTASNDVNVITYETGTNVVIAPENTIAVTVEKDRTTLDNIFHLVPTNTAPTSPVDGDIYMDDGTNTISGNPHPKFRSNGVWVEF